MNFCKGARAKVLLEVDHKGKREQLGHNMCRIIGQCVEMHRWRREIGQGGKLSKESDEKRRLAVKLFKGTLARGVLLEVNHKGRESKLATKCAEQFVSSVPKMKGWRQEIGRCEKLPKECDEKRRLAVKLFKGTLARGVLLEVNHKGRESKLATKCAEQVASSMPKMNCWGREIGCGEKLSKECDEKRQQQ